MHMTANTDYEQREEVITLSDLNPFEELIFPVMDDSEYEGRSNEIFFVQAQLDPNGQNSERVKIASDLARTPITIIDNEVRPFASIGFIQRTWVISEGAGEVVLLIESDGRNVDSVDVTYSFQNGSETAEVGLDYLNGGGVGTLLFPPGTTVAAITVPVIDDESAESTEFFTVSLFPGQDVALTADQATVYIEDNDAVEAQLSMTSYTISEAAASVEVVIQISTATETVQVNISTVNGTALAGLDYVQREVQLTFSPGDFERSVTIQVINDTIQEDTELFFVTLHSPVSNLKVELPQTNTGIFVIDDDKVGDPLEPSLSVVSTSTTSVSLVWTQDPIQPVTRFFLSWTYTGPCDPQPPQSVIIGGEERSYIIIGLEEGANYTFGLTAINGIGTSPENMVTGYTPPAAPSGPPRNLQATEITESSVVIQWEEIDCLDQNGIIIRYEITLNGSLLSSTDPGQFTSSILNLSPETGYIITVTGVNGAGNGPASTITIRTARRPVGNPLEPSLSVVSTSTTSASLVWTQDPIQPVTRFFLSWTYTGPCDPQPPQSVIIGGEERSYTIMDLEEGANYTFGLTAINGIGTSHENMVTGYTLLAAPSGPPRNLQATEITESSIVIQWEEIDCLDQNGIIIRYEITLNGILLSSTDPGQFTSSILNLSPETSYIITVTGVNEAGNGPASTITIRTAGRPEPCVNFTDTNIEVSESDGMAMVCVTLMGNFEERLQPLVVTIGTTVKSGATDMATGGGVDYESANFTLMFNADDETEQVQCAQVNIIDDLLGNEKVEQFSVRFISSNVTTCSGNTDDSVCVSITDNDKPVVTWEDRQVSVNESDPLQVHFVCFNTDIGSAQAYTIYVAARAKGTNPATEDDDYNILSSQSFLVEVSPAGTRYCVAFTTEDDSLAEGLEQFEFYFVNLPNDFANTGDPDTVGVDIIDDDMPEVNIPLMMRNMSVPEPVGEVEICIELSTGITEQVVVTAVTGPKSGAANQATADTDYSTTTLMLTFEPSGESQIVCGNVSIINDLLGNEPYELFSVTITEVSGGTIGIGAEAESCVEIIDNDVPVITWEEPEVTIPEGGSEQVCFTSDIGTAQPYQVRVGVRGKGDRPAAQGDDYTLPNSLEFSFTMESGERFCVDVNTMDDTLAEGREQFELFFDVIDPASSATRGEPQVVCVNIADNDELSVSFAEESYTAMEDDGTVQVCFMTSGGHPDRDVAVTVQPVDTADAVSACGTPQAFEVSDFTPGTLSMTFPASSTSATLCVDIPLEDDTVYEGPEHFLVRFTNIPNDDTAVGAISETCVTILDPEDEPCVNFTDTNIEVSESDGTAMVCVTLMGNFEVRLQPLLVTIGTAVKSGATDKATGGGVDYESANFTLMFNADDATEQVQCAQVNITDDVLGNEKVEQFSVRFISFDVRRCSGNTDDSVCVSITDNDKPVVTWEDRQVSVNEGDPLQVCFNTDIGSAQAYTIDVAARAKGTNPATEDVDYEIVSPRSFLVEVSETGGRYCVAFTTEDDSLAEDLEQFEFYFVNLPNDFANTGDPDTVGVDIIDDDNPEVNIPLMMRNISVPESVGEVPICIVLSTGITEQVVVTAVTGPKSGAANQATADTDYSTTTLMLTFEPSGESQIVCGNVSIINDLLGNEPNELFSVTITEVSGGTVSIGAGDESCVEIIDDDEVQEGPTSGMLRLADGSNEREGRVEIFANGEWGTVCDDNWDLLDALVVCKQLGLGTVPEAFIEAEFGRGTGEIWLDEVGCTGEEDRLIDCSSLGIGNNNCGHSEDAGVRCYANANCSDGAIRLVNGSTSTNGRVEVCQFGRWGTVCDDVFDTVDAMVACNQLGFGGGLVIDTTIPGSGPIWLDDVACDGTEVRLVDCSATKNDQSNCGHNEDVSIMCSADT